jgi:hypothetical protein
MAVSRPVPAQRLALPMTAPHSRPGWPASRPARRSDHHPHQLQSALDQLVAEERGQMATGRRSRWW